LSGARAIIRKLIGSVKQKNVTKKTSILLKLVHLAINKDIDKFFNKNKDKNQFVQSAIKETYQKEVNFVCHVIKNKKLKNKNFRD